MDKIIIEIASIIDENREKVLDEKLNTLTMQNFVDYLKTLRDIPTSDWLIDTYNQRQVEYSKYKFVKEEGDKGWAGLLDWEFAKKLASLLGRAEDLWFKVHIMSFSSGFSKVVVSTKEILEKQPEN